MKLAFRAQFYELLNNPCLMQFSLAPGCSAMNATEKKGFNINNNKSDRYCFRQKYNGIVSVLINFYQIIGVINA